MNGYILTPRSENTFVAVKVLTGHMTDLCEHAIAWEPDAFRLISQTPRSPHCPPLLDEFTFPGEGSAGSHICFVMPLYGGDVRMLYRERTTALPFPLAKRILLHLLCGIAHAHERGVVHTDIKPANILFSTTMTTEDIEAWMVEEPSRRHEPETSHDGIVQSAVSQPLPMITEDEAMRATYLLGDFGSGTYCLDLFGLRRSQNFSATVGASQRRHSHTDSSTTTRNISGSEMGPTCGHLDFRLPRTRLTLISS